MIKGVVISIDKNFIIFRVVEGHAYEKAFAYRHKFGFVEIGECFNLEVIGMRCDPNVLEVKKSVIGFDFDDEYDGDFLVWNYAHTPKLFTSEVEFEITEVSSKTCTLSDLIKMKYVPDCGYCFLKPRILLKKEITNYGNGNRLIELRRWKHNNLITISEFDTLSIDVGDPYEFLKRDPHYIGINSNSYCKGAILIQYGLPNETYKAVEKEIPPIPYCNYWFNHGSLYQDSYDKAKYKLSPMFCGHSYISKMLNFLRRNIDVDYLIVAEINVKYEICYDHKYKEDAFRRIVIQIPINAKVDG